MKTMKIIKSFKDTSLQNVFVAETNDGVINIEADLRKEISEAEETVCLVLESGMTDGIAQMLCIAARRTGKYVIVPSVDETKYQKLKGVMIAREADNIKGNYAIIDATKLFFFDEKFNGYAVADKQAAETVQQIFLKEFWENGKAEFLDKKLPCAEVTFDVPPVYGNEKVLFDESFGGETDVGKLIRNGKLFAFTHKIDPAANGKIIFKRTDLNADYVKTASNGNLFLARDLPCPLVSDGVDTYILNFDVAKHRTLPEQGKGRLFAVKCGNLTVGKTYRFYRHKTVEELIGADVLNIDGNVLTISETAEEAREITADLRAAAEYGKMDGETLAARLEKKYPAIFNTEKFAGTVAFNVEVKIAKRSFNAPAKIYGEFASAKDGLRRKWKELTAAAEKLKLDKKISRYEADIDGIADRAAYTDAVNKLNEAVTLINNYGDEDVDEALSEVTGKKKKAFIQPAVIAKLSADIPVNGKLYQSNDKYEYVLTSESRLAAAIAETEAAGIDSADVQFLAE